MYNEHDIDPWNWIYTEVMYNKNKEIGQKLKLYTGMSAGSDD